MDKEKSAFMKRMDEIAHEIQSLYEANDNPNFGIILIAAEEASDDDSAVLACTQGRGKEIIAGLESFATNPDTSRLFRHVAINTALGELFKK